MRAKVELSAPTLKACLAHLCQRQSEGLGTFELLDLAEAARGLYELEALPVLAAKAAEAGWMVPIETVKAQAPKKRRSRNWEEAEKNRAAAEKSGLTFDDLDKALAAHGMTAYADSAGMKPANAGQVVLMARRRGYLPPSALRWLQGLRGEEVNSSPRVTTLVEPESPEMELSEEAAEAEQKAESRKAEEPKEPSPPAPSPLEGRGEADSAPPAREQKAEVRKVSLSELRERLEESSPPTKTLIYWARARFCCRQMTADGPAERRLVKGWAKSGLESIEAYLRTLESDEVGVLV